MTGIHLKHQRLLPRRWRQGLLIYAVFAALVNASPQRVQAQNFDVYCTNNSDGTVTCTGWEGGETLTCVNSSGGTSSCSTPSGRSFVCIRDLGGVASCRKNGQSALERPLGGGTDCTFTGDGNFVCSPPRKRSPVLIPDPTMRDPVIQDQAPLINPSMDLNIIQPLKP